MQDLKLLYNLFLLNGITQEKKGVKMILKMVDRHGKTNNIPYELKDNDNIDMQIIIQKLSDLSSEIYHNSDAEYSYRIDNILDGLIEFIEV